MSVRHRLIRWLSFGDAILMNIEFCRWGAIRTKEAGDILIENVRIDHNSPAAVSLGLPAPAAALRIERNRHQRVTIKDSHFAAGVER